jgi:hypothetical protein
VVFKSVEMATAYVPILNIPWIKGVLAGSYSRPEFRVGEEVMIVDKHNVEGEHLERSSSGDDTFRLLIIYLRLH